MPEPTPAEKRVGAADSTLNSFEKGIDRNSPRTNIKTGGYEDAQNMLLLSGVSGKHPTSMALDSELDTDVTWPPGNPQWCAPFSYATYVEATQLLSFTTLLLIARAGGQYHSYQGGTIVPPVADLPFDWAQSSAAGSITHTDINAIDGATALTWMGWVYTNSTTAVPGMTKGNVYFLYAAAGAWACGETAVWERRAGTITTGTWVHVAVTYDGALAAADRITMYIGAVNTPTAGGNATATMPTSAAVLEMFQNTTADTPGQMAHVRWWTSVLTQAEIAAEMASATRVRAADSLLAAEYQNGVATDSSGNGFNGTLTGDTFFVDNVAASPTAVTNVRRLANVAGSGADIWQVNSFVYDKYLVTTDGRNPPMKYGQLFLGYGGEVRPYMFPLGSLPITAVGPQLTGEVVTGTGTLELDAVVPGGGSRVGTHSAKLDAGETFIATFAAPKNFLTGPDPYPGRDFDATDSLAYSVYKTATGATPTLTIQFSSTVTDFSVRFTFTSATLPVGTTWSDAITQLRSTAVLTGGAVWSDIRAVRITNNDGTNTVYVDDLYFLYSDAPPAAQMGCAHKDRVILGGAPLIGTVPSLSTIIYSNPEAPDNFATSGVNNTQAISGGNESLAKTNQITALREYQDSVIVGTPSAIFAWTVGASGSPAKSTVSTEHGIDSHRGVVETPNGSLLFPWQRGYYILRSTGRQFVGAKIQPIVANTATDDPSWTMAVLDETTKTIRFWFREGADAVHTTEGLVFDYVLAQETAEAVWPSRMTQMADWAVPVYISGIRRVVYTKSGSSHLWVLGDLTTGSLTSYIDTPWLARHDDTKITKWMGLAAAYSSTVPVNVYIRYANNPGEFDAATFTLSRALPANPSIIEGARVVFGGSTRWAQVRFEATTLVGGGFELFPPLYLVPIDTQRSPN